jgi:hypothetical protein
MWKCSQAGEPEMWDHRTSLRLPPEDPSSWLDSPVRRDPKLQPSVNICSGNALTFGWRKLVLCLCATDESPKFTVDLSLSGWLRIRYDPMLTLCSVTVNWTRRIGMLGYQWLMNTGQIFQYFRCASGLTRRFVEHSLTLSLGLPLSAESLLTLCCRDSHSVFTPVVFLFALLR